MAMGDWRWLQQGESSELAIGAYEKVLLNYFNEQLMWGMLPIFAPGSNQLISTESSRECLGKVLNFITK